MSNSPIQIVLNTNNFFQALENKRGGPNKDFYEGNDGEFVEHRDKIFAELAEIRDMQIENEFTQISYAKLTLKQSALAKSHRPTSAMFTKNIAPVIGAGDLGELFIELQPSAISRINSKILEAETTTRYKTDRKGDKDVEVPNPSAIRSELGSIEDIRPYTASDKRKFSLDEGFQWISNPQTGGAYIIELFERPMERKDWDSYSPEKLKLFRSFSDGLARFGSGLIASRLVDGDFNSPMIGVRLEESELPASVQLMPVPSAIKRNTNVKEINKDKGRHADLLKFLDNHPLVKKIILPPIISRSATNTEAVPGAGFTLPKPAKDKSYPKIGIIDGGVSSSLIEWIEDRWGLLSTTDKDEEHGTFIGGLLIFSHLLNGPEICNETDGCKIIDLDILPKAQFFPNYFTRPLEFFKELEVAVKELKARTGVRVFNFSLNIEEHVSTDGYSPPAKILDKIAEENDVIFIISAGNTKPADFRKEWPKDSTEALSILAASRNDTIKKPAESCRNLSISALNPPNMSGIIPFAPSSYSCRGPGIRVGLKPDLAHVGGSGTKVPGSGFGLRSFNGRGTIVDGCGTSYAAPHVAKTLASLDHAIEGDVSRETLIALAVHHATLPQVLKDPKLRDVAKHLVGFGIPACSESILEGNDHSITLVFANRIMPGLKMSFDFTWPPSLVQDGNCLGHARMTIVSTPPFDYRFGAEFVRVNIQGYLRQQQKDGKYLGRLNPMYLPSSGEGHLYEKDQIKHGFKWSPVKVFEKTFKRGVGPSTQWKLDVEYLARDGENLPKTGVPFTVLLTISDPDKKASVFTEMRQTLTSLGVQILDIKTAARIVPRV